VLAGWPERRALRVINFEMAADGGDGVHLAWSELMIGSPQRSAHSGPWRRQCPPCGHGPPRVPMALALTPSRFFTSHPARSRASSPGQESHDKPSSRQKRLIPSSAGQT
jgi:hypothetical protein